MLLLTLTLARLIPSSASDDASLMMLLRVFAVDASVLLLLQPFEIQFDMIPSPLSDNRGAAARRLWDDPRSGRSKGTQASITAREGSTADISTAVTEVYVTSS